MFHIMDSLADLSDPERVAERIAFRVRLESEEAAAAYLCERGLTGPSAWWGTRLRKEEGSLTSGVVRELSKRFPSRCERISIRARSDSSRAGAARPCVRSVVHG